MLDIQSESELAVNGDDKALGVLNMAILLLLSEVNSAERDIASALHSLKACTDTVATEFAEGRSIEPRWILGHAEKLDKANARLHAIFHQIREYAVIRKTMLDN